MSDTILLPYQQRWVADKSDVKIAEKSRRTGFTWSEAADDALTAAKAVQAGGCDTLYLGFNKDLAVEFVETAGAWAKGYDLAASAIDDASEVLDPEDKEAGILAFKIVFNSGNKIVALSSKPRSLRGRQGIVVLDEFAFHPEQEELLKAAIALLMWGGKVRIISTHDGEENFFNELINDVRAKKRPFSLHRVTLDDAIGDGLYQRICQKLKRPWSLEAQVQWRADLIAFYADGADEELMCIPRSGGGAYIPGTLLQSRMVADTPVLRWEQKAAFAEAPKFAREVECRAWLDAVVKPHLDALDPSLESIFGEDFGRSGDLTVIWPAQIRGNLVRHTPFVVELRNIPFEQQRQVLFYIVDRLPRFRAGKLDSRGNGQYLAEVAMQRYGSGKIEQVMISQEWYLANMPQYKAAWEDAMITAPRDSLILDDHRALRVVKGIPRVPEGATNNKGAQQRHGDSAIAGCMMYAASNADTVEYGYQAAPKANHRTADAPSERSEDDDYAGLSGRQRGAY